jgi:hypothetical protein
MANFENRDAIRELRKVLLDDIGEGKLEKSVGNYLKNLILKC